MLSSSSSEIKKELQHLDHEELVKVALRLARFKKENKQLLHYILFAAHEPLDYAAEVKEAMNEALQNLNTNSAFLAKKTLRKVLRIAADHIRFSNHEEVAAEITLHALSILNALPAKLMRAMVIANMKKAQLKKMEAILAELHPDLGYEYRNRFEAIMQ